MAKPIVVIYLPTNFNIGGSGENNAPMYLMEALNGGFGEKYENKIKFTDYWKEYYWFCFYKYGIEAPEFQVFYEKDFTDIQFAELKQIIDDSLKQIKPK